MIDTIYEEENNKLKELKDTYDGEREQTKNTNIEALETMKHDLIKQIEKLDKDFEVHFNKYASETDHKAESYKKLLNENQIQSGQIDDFQKAINRLKEQYAYWHLKKLQNKKEGDDRNFALKKERDTIVRHYHDLKKKMLHFREDEERRLANLTMNSKMCMDKLTEFQKLGEKILKTAELCRKLETEKEKVLPFYQSDPDTQEEVPPEFQIEKIKGVKPDKYNEFTFLDTFYKRFNKVMLDKLAIEKQKQTLDKENMFFKSLLKQYLDGVSVNDDVMNSNNPLMVVNNKVNLNRPPVERMDGGMGQTVIEGNQVVTSKELQMKANYG